MLRIRRREDHLMRCINLRNAREASLELVYMINTQMLLLWMIRTNVRTLFWVVSKCTVSYCILLVISIPANHWTFSLLFEYLHGGLTVTFRWLSSVRHLMVRSLHFIGCWACWHVLARRLRHLVPPSRYSQLKRPVVNERMVYWLLMRSTVQAKGICLTLHTTIRCKTLD